MSPSPRAELSRRPLTLRETLPMHLNPHRWINTHMRIQTIADFITPPKAAVIAMPSPPYEATRLLQSIRAPTRMHARRTISLQGATRTAFKNLGIGHYSIQWTVTDTIAWQSSTANNTKTFVSEGLCNPQLMFYREGCALAANTWSKW